MFYEKIHKIYGPISAKMGDSTEVRSYLVNLMDYTHTHKGPLDVMDYIFQ